MSNMVSDMMRKIVFILGISITITILTLLVEAQSQIGPDISANNFSVIPSVTDPRYVDVSFDIINLGGGNASEIQWQLVVLESYNTSTSSLVDVEVFSESYGPLSSGQSQMFTQIIDLQSSQFMAGKTYYLMLIVDTKPTGADTNTNNNIFIDNVFNLFYGPWAFTSVNVTSVNAFKIQIPTQQTQPTVPTVSPNINLVSLNLFYSQNPNNPNLGGYDINLNYNVSNDISVCMDLSVLDVKGNVNYNQNDCTNNVLSAVLSSLTTNDIYVSADADSTKDDVIRIRIYDFQNQNLVYEESIDISSNIQVSGSVNVLDHYIGYDQQIGKWVFYFSLDNKYPQNFADIRFNIVSNYINGVTGDIEQSLELSPYYQLNYGSQILEFKVPAFLDEINYTATVEGLGITITNEVWSKDYINLTTITSPITPQQQSPPREHDVDFSFYEGLFTNGTPSKESFNLVSIAAFEGMTKYTTTALNCLSNNINNYVAYSITNVTETPTGAIVVSYNKASSNYLFTEKYAVIAVPQNTSCNIAGILNEDFVAQSLPPVNPRNKTGWRVEPVRPEWNNQSLDSITGLCPQGSSFSSARVMDQGQLNTLTGGFTFDFNFLPEALFSSIFIKCG